MFRAFFRTQGWGLRPRISRRRSRAAAAKDKQQDGDAADVTDDYGDAMLAPLLVLW